MEKSKTKLENINEINKMGFLKNVWNNFFSMKIGWGEKQNEKKPAQEGLPNIFQAQVEKECRYTGARRL